MSDTPSADADAIPPDVRRERAIAALRMYERLDLSLQALGEYRRMLSSAAGVNETQWGAMDLADRERALKLGRARLIHAAELKVAEWTELPAYSPERAAVLLRGAAAMGIETTWAGWKGPAPEELDSGS